MSFFSLILGSVDGIDDSGSIMIVGFLLVVVVLALLAAITSAIGAFFSSQAARSAAHAAQAAAEKTPSPAGASATPVAEAAESVFENSPAFFALIAAAVHSVAGDRAHRIVSISSSSEGWAQEGRRQIFSSHRVR
jgi:Na+-transporting methylmalonyl-CoA/oxaloacetate decarboxylase gamma subunit